MSHHTCHMGNACTDVYFIFIGIAFCIRRYRASPPNPAFNHRSHIAYYTTNKSCSLQMDATLGASRCWGDAVAQKPSTTTVEQCVTRGYYKKTDTRRTPHVYGISTYIARQLTRCA